MIKNMKIRKSLVMGYAITIAISVVIIVASLIMMNTQKKAYTDIINQNVRATYLITDCRLSSNRAARYLRDAVLSYNTESVSKSSIDKLVADAESIVGEIDEKLSELDSVNPLPDKSMMSQYTSQVQDWKAEAISIVNLIKSGDIGEAANAITGKCTPALETAAATSRTLADALSADEDEVIRNQTRNSNICLISIIAAMIIAAFFVIRMCLIIIKSIVIPVEESHAALVGYSQGKLDVPVNYRSTSELGEMCDALRTSQTVLSECISDTCHLLEEMSNGNFDVRTKDEKMYVGALSSILSSVRAINHSLSDALTQINQSAEQVSSGAEQVSTGAQSLAQGATEQASAVEELSATIAEISNNARNNARSSEEAMNHSQDAGERISESAQYMQEMVTAMEKISDSSAEIGKIIDTIENIAFQTNILALNAAVEAARAGSAGKGFAVVADEVRNLASKSDQAAKATKDLIDRSINSVKDGNEIVKRVSESLDKTVESSGKVLDAVKRITKAAGEESEAIAQVTEGIDQISAVVQTNSATSEQSAAASEELSSQASLMKELLSRFKTHQESYMPRASQPTYSAPAASSYDDMSMDSGSSSSAASVFSKY